MTDGDNSERSVRLVHLQLLPLLSGVQKVTLDEFRMISAERFEPVLICKEAGPLSRAVDAASHYVPALVRPISPVKDISALTHLFRLFRRLVPDIVHTHSSKTGILGRIAARLAGVPVVIHTVHGYAFPYASSRLVRGLYLLLEYIAGKFCDALVVLNKADKDIAINRLGIPPHKVHLIPNGIETEKYQDDTHERRERVRREVLGVTDDVVCIGMVGRLWRQKNPLCLLNAALNVLERAEKPVHFYFIGDGELRAEIEQLVVKHGLAEQVVLLGWRDDVPDLLSALDVFVLPSLWEGMPLAILEAMASSLPVIASDIAGNSDLVLDGEDGFLFEANDVNQLTECLSVLIKDSGLRTRMGESGHHKVITDYQLKGRVKQMIQLYETLLAAKGISKSS